MMSIYGINKEKLDTPSLLIDLDLLEANISMMANYYREKKIALRPHMKSHKCPAIAHKQIKAGAIGITCQKLSEAEVMASAGIEGILISNQIVNDQKVKKLANLIKHYDIIIGVDNLENINHLSRVAKKNNVTINVAVEIYAGRCGVDPGEPAVSLAREISKNNSINFRGIWHHKGLSSIERLEERRKVYRDIMGPVVETKSMIEDEGIEVEIFSAGDTPTWNLAPEIPGITDVQVGSYLFMDTQFKSIEGMEKLSPALTLLTTVISRPRPDKAIIDIGLKSHGIHYGVKTPPKIKGITGVHIESLSEEHGILHLVSPSEDLKVGDKIEVIPSHCCTTVNLHDEYIGMRDDVVEIVWPISARGKYK